PFDEENRYDLLICVANWPASRSQAWHVLLEARGIENQCFVAGVNRLSEDGNGIQYDGGSAIIDPMGKVLIKKNKEEAIIQNVLHRETIINTRKKFPFLEDADHFIIKLKS
ncbi:MAG: nitrilase-related carbon-nitrogen hydrolase, partial [Chitinophagaceae bacterium]